MHFSAGFFVFVSFCVGQEYTQNDTIRQRDCQRDPAALSVNVGRCRFRENFPRVVRARSCVFTRAVTISLNAVSARRVVNFWTRRKTVLQITHRN
jgi:hypothetical protein